MEAKLIKDVFPIGGSPYFFQNIFQLLNLSSDLYSADDLAYGYFLGHSGCKFCSPLLIALMSDSEVVSADTSQRIFGILRSRFGENWTRLYATSIVDYNPVHNYDMSEQIHRELSGKDKNTNTKNLTDTTNHGMSNVSDDFIYGFNSSEEQPSNKYTSQDGGTTTVSSTGTDVNDGTNQETEDIIKTRAGNIGVTTTQQMIQQERELWEWNFIDQLYRDIDSVLTLKVYDTCRV